MTKEKGVKDGEREGSIESRGAFCLETQEEQPALLFGWRLNKKSGGEIRESYCFNYTKEILSTCS